MINAKRRQIILATTSALLSELFPFSICTSNILSQKFDAYPFSLGVASGYPHADSVILWTRLAPFPALPNGGLTENNIPVRWELATDETMKNIMQQGSVNATPEWGYSLHIQVKGLQPQREYFYRFLTGDAISPVGRTHTFPLLTNDKFNLHFAYVSCQQYEQGYYAAYRHIVADHPDLIIHLGDYIYESSWGKAHVRKHLSGEPHTLNEYRARYALYRSDLDLQKAHAVCPWLMIWDDHEVQNDYANNRSQFNIPHEQFLLRRAAAYQAYYEHMPLPATMCPHGAVMPIFTRIAIGQLAHIYMLDGRQYRSYQACPPENRGGGANVVDETCLERLEISRSYLGIEQEKWLYKNLHTHQPHWNILAQPTLVAQCDRQSGLGQKFGTDAWDGYPVARQRLIDQLEQTKTRNNIVIGGDVHTFYVTELKKDFNDPKSLTVAAEIVGSSVTSQSWSQARIDAVVRENPHILYGNSESRGYVRVHLTERKFISDLRGLENVTDPATKCRTLASYMVEKGNATPQLI